MLKLKKCLNEVSSIKFITATIVGITTRQITKEYKVKLSVTLPMRRLVLLYDLRSRFGFDQQ